jgi:GT2 family glycosyltransferase
MVTYNRLEYTRLALEAVLKLEYPNLRVVIWDNASTDGTIAYLRERIQGLAHVTGIASPTNRGVVYPMNEVWSSNPEAELLAKIDNDTLVPPELIRRLAECHLQSKRFGVLSGFHFRQEGEALAEAHRIKMFDGIQVLPQPYVGGCAVMIRRGVFQTTAPITCRTDGPDGRPFMDSGWTAYQQRLTDAGFINGYPWPPIHVDHMEDTRSPHCIRSDEHQHYKREERGMGLEEFTHELCVWRPNWEGETNGRTDGATDPRQRRANRES